MPVTVAITANVPAQAATDTPGAVRCRVPEPALKPLYAIIGSEPVTRRAALAALTASASSVERVSAASVQPADVTFEVEDGGGKIHTAAQISGKAASMGEGVVQSVLDALIKDFTTKLAAI